MNAVTAKKIFEGPPEHAVAKCRERWADFRSKGWEPHHITGRDQSTHGHHGLAWYLRPHQDLGRIFTHYVEILGRQAGHGERSRLHYWKGAPYATLAAKYGRETIKGDA